MSRHKLVDGELLVSVSGIQGGRRVREWLILYFVGRCVLLLALVCPYILLFALLLLSFFALVYAVPWEL